MFNKGALKSFALVHVWLPMVREERGVEKVSDFACHRVAPQPIEQRVRNLSEVPPGSWIDRSRVNERFAPHTAILIEQCAALIS
jgi:hypothetical protein